MAEGEETRGGGSKDAEEFSELKQSNQLQN